MSKSAQEIQAEFKGHMRDTKDACDKQDGKPYDNSPGAREPRGRARVDGLFTGLFGDDLDDALGGTDPISEIFKQK